MEKYMHVVQYYETDKMGISHHSNYIRWMEEARVDYLKQIGWDYAKLEELGIISPVVEANCKYKKPTTFADEILITVSIVAYKGVKLVLHYDMSKDDGTPVAEAESSHCFVDANGRPINLSRSFSEFHAALLELVEG